MIGTLHLVYGSIVFAVGAVIGSFLNVCIHRIPFQKSIIWPASHCPRCLRSISPLDNVPILAWLLLRGECRRCGLPISIRYPAIEALSGVLWVGVYWMDVYSPDRAGLATFPFQAFLPMIYHGLLVSLLLVATFIDYDYYIIPDAVTVPGMIIGMLMGGLIPTIRPEPDTAFTVLSGFATGVVGLVVGGGLVWSVRGAASVLLRREAMGFGDVTLMAMVGTFLGWRIAVLTFFLAPFFAFAHVFWKLGLWIKNQLFSRGRGRRTSRELPFGPYLSMAAVTLMLSWDWLWPHWARDFFEQFQMVCFFLAGMES